MFKAIVRTTVDVISLNFCHYDRDFLQTSEFARKLGFQGVTLSALLRTSSSSMVYTRPQETNRLSGLPSRPYARSSLRDQPPVPDSANHMHTQTLFHLHR